jgi:hypothetical protein
MSPRALRHLPLRQVSDGRLGFCLGPARLKAFPERLGLFQGADELRRTGDDLDLVVPSIRDERPEDIIVLSNRKFIQVDRGPHDSPLPKFTRCRPRYIAAAPLNHDKAAIIPQGYFGALHRNQKPHRSHTWDKRLTNAIHPHVIAVSTRAVRPSFARGA